MPFNYISAEQLYQIYRQHPTITTDSRQIEQGCLFFALKGDRFNGNEFALQALEKGAAYSIIDEAAFQKDDRCLLVEDVLTMLQQLATHHRRQFDIPVLAITGSNGKTTTKELVSAVLASHFNAHYTRGNLNNHIGVPMTLLAMPPETEVAVIEMGANHPGEIDFLCRIAEPTHGLITNVGKAHLEGFGGFEGVKRTKSELYRYLAGRKGVVFINQDEPFLRDLATGNDRIVFYRRSQPLPAKPDVVEIKLQAEEPFVQVAFATDPVEWISAQSHLIGIYNFNNIMTAVTVGKFFGVPAPKIKAAIETYIPSNNRSQLLTIGSNTFIMDAYNANPTSMKNALSSFSNMKAVHKVAILGAMKELGEYSEEEHRHTAEFAQSLHFDRLILVGSEFKEVAEKNKLSFFENTAQLKSWYQAQQFSDTLFFIKGSRSIGLEKMIEDKP
jgi:UDP-N-acetylmuramoyl-tripeptide--D-alanyl-D-alanine ligase